MEMRPCAPESFTKKKQKIKHFFFFLKFIKSYFTNKGMGGKCVLIRILILYDIILCVRHTIKQITGGMKSTKCSEAV